MAFRATDGCSRFAVVNGVVDKQAFRWAWISLAAGCLWSLLVLLPVLLHEGWPANHDEVAPVLRLAALAGQWDAGHSIPVWSVSQQFGYGSPMPSLYHKTHMYLSAAAFAGTGSLKAALVLPLYLLMVFGFCGMVFCLRHALGGRHPWLWLAGAATLLVSNYAITDWAVRGAFAEFASLMVLPWLFAWCLILIGEGRWSVWIAPLVALLALSHAAIGLFSLIPLGLAVGVGLWRWRGQARHWCWPAVCSACLATLLAAPFLLPMAAASRFSRTDRLELFTPRTHSLPWTAYLSGPDWALGTEHPVMTVHLDLALLLLLPVYVLLLAWPYGPRMKQVFAHMHRDRWNGVFLLGVLLVMGWLQSPQAYGFYERVPGAQYLQFAWRLLAYLTVVLIVCGCVALSRLGLLGTHAYGARMGHALAALGAAVLLAHTAYPKMWWNWSGIGWISPQKLQEEMRTGDYHAFGEFLPMVNWPAPGPGLLDAAIQMSNWLSAPPAQNCELTAAANQARERSSGLWQASCPDESWAALPVFFAPGMVIATRRPGETSWQKIIAKRTCADPRLQVLLPQGQSEIQIQFPDWARMVAAGFASQGFDFRRDCSALAR